MSVVVADSNVFGGTTFLLRRIKASVCDLGRRFTLWPFSPRASSSESITIEESQPETERPELPRDPMPEDQHWLKAINTIVASITGARNAATLQRAASAQLDAAAYALEDLVQELTAAMPVPGMQPKAAPADVVVRMIPRPPRQAYPNVFAEKGRNARKAPKTRKAPKPRTRRTRKAA